MKKKLVNSALFFLVALVSIQTYAQEKNFWATKSITIDGVSDEWVHNLTKYNDKTKLTYAIANDATNLYILIESADLPTSAKVLSNSITMSINSAGKKRKLTSITFPIIGKNDLFNSGQTFTASRNQDPLLPNSINVQNDLLSRSTDIKINGFYKIPDGTFSADLVNTYGIKAAAKFNQNKILVYEVSIPLSRLNISLKQKKPVAYNIKINGSSNYNLSSENPYNGRMPGGGGGTVGRGIPGIGGGGTIGVDGRIPGIGGTIHIGGRQRPPANRTNNTERRMDIKPVDFWVKYHLAKTKF
jgi:hypothetical protein